MTSTRVVLLDGYYGARNIGDELILSSLTQLIRQHGRETDTNYRIIAGSTDPAYTKAYHEVDRVVPRFKLSPNDHREWFRAVSKADEFWIGGGGLFGPKKMLKYAAGTAIARSVGTRVATVGIGVRPFSDGPEHSRRLAREFARHADSLTVRDTDSAEALREIGVRQPIEVVADPVFGYDTDAVRNTRILPEIGNRLGERTIVVSVREPEARQLDRDAFARSLDRVIDATHASVLFVPFQTNRRPSDVAVAADIADRMDNSESTTIVEEELDFREMTRLVADAPLVVGMRLHSVIISATVGTPVVGLAYHPKCASILHQLNQNDVQWCDALDSATFARSVIRAWEEGTPGVQAAASKLRQRTSSLIESVESGQSACSPIRTPLLVGEVTLAGIDKALR